MNDLMGYERLAQEALRDVIRLALERVADDGLPGEHRIYIKFRTRAEGVVLPEHLLAQYPQEITI
ncbi:MAG: ClpXP protease specificity-enhancing factor SspB, partial [Myxococcota bacterium]